jgi:hypothetical protein
LADRRHYSPAKLEPYVLIALRVFQRAIKWMSSELDGVAKVGKKAADFCLILIGFDAGNAKGFFRTMGDES